MNPTRFRPIVKNRKCAICEQSWLPGKPVRESNVELRALNLIGNYAHDTCLDKWREKIADRIKMARDAK